jgi:hypothetical protein
MINSFKREGIGRFEAAQKEVFTIGHKEIKEYFRVEIRFHKGRGQDDLDIMVAIEKVWRALELARHC